MKILHITPHMGGGVGTVIMGWMEKEYLNEHEIICLDFINSKADLWADRTGHSLFCSCSPYVEDSISRADIVLVHYWDSPFLADLFADPIPDCRLIFWCHKNYGVSVEEMMYPDIFVATSPIIYDNIVDKTGKFATTIDYLVKKGKEGNLRTIWSTGNMDKFLAIQPKPHKGFNIGYVGTVDYKKMYPQFITMCLQISEQIPDVHFTIIGENNLGLSSDSLFTFTGKVDDVAPYLAEMDVFGYPLRSDHYGTCEQSLGEAMAAGVVPVVMDNPAEKIICTPDKKGFPSGIKCRYEDEYPKAVKWIYEHPELRKKYSDNCRIRARELYSIDTMIQQWEDVFESMMEKPKVKRGVL